MPRRWKRLRGALGGQGEDSDGDLVCIFPEGKLTTDGEIGEFKTGIETIVQTTPVPVVPIALGGLWGRWFSPQGGLFKGRMRPFSRVEVTAGEPIEPEKVTAAQVRDRVQALRGDQA